MPDRSGLRRAVAAGCLLLAAACAADVPARPAPPTTTPAGSRPAPTPAADGLVRDWSTETVSTPLPPAGGGVLVAVRSGSHADPRRRYDRIEWRFGGGLPGYSLGYDRDVAISERGGARRSPKGRGDFAAVFYDASAHDEDTGRWIVRDANGGGLPVLLEYRLVGDAHGYVSYALGLAEPVRFRVYEYPDRLVVDFAAGS